MTEMMEVAMQGPPGAPGAPGEVDAGTAVAGEFLARGMPLYLSRATGQAGVADAAVYTKSFVAGYATANTAAGFVVTLAFGAVEMADWSAVAGTPLLLPGVPYFLKPGGGLSASPPAKPASAALTVVGSSLSPTRLMVRPMQPFLL